MQQHQLPNRTLVEELKTFCATERERIYSRHQFGIGGREIVEEYTRLADTVIRRIYQHAVGAPESVPIAILALGGYGREELNPYSDIDIMLVYDESRMSLKQLDPYATQLIPVLWDVRFDVGHSCRSIKECIRATYDDIFSKTSMLEARYIVGSKAVYRKFQKQTSKHVFKKRVGKFIAQKNQEWNERHESYGSTIYLQEPNIKESVGGLRDFHTAIWIAAVRYGEKEIQGLCKRGIIPQTVSDACEASLDYLWRLRNELHYVNQKRSDQLTFEVQELIAKNLGYHDDGHTLAEETLMRDYYLHAEHLYEFAKLVIDRVKHKESRLKQWLAPLWTKALSDGFALIRNEIGFQHGYSNFAVDATRIMKLFVHRQQLGCRVSADVRHQLAVSLDLINDNFRRSPEVATCFLSILRYPKVVAATLRRMHRWQVLDRYLPEFGVIRSLVRLERYHQYTVDEHTLYAIENLEAATLAKLEDGQVFLDIMEGVEKPELLRLAILLHDVGKGVQGLSGHENRSVEMAKIVLNRLGLNAGDQEVVLFLILRHLDMSYTAQQRDLDDPKVIERFAELVKDEQHLKMLYLLTFADMRAVSPSVWSGWNAVLLWELYTRTLKFLQGRMVPQLDELWAGVIQLIGDRVDRAAIEQHFERMPESGLISQTPEFIGKQIQLVQQLGDAPITVSCFAEDPTHTQLGICTRDARGIFRRITGVLAIQNINILSAVINTRSDGIVIDVLTVTDGRTEKEAVSKAQCHQIAETLTAVWKGETDVESLLQKQRKRPLPAYVQRRSSSPEIHINNDESERATIIDIRAPDRVGLLYAISNTFYELGLDIGLAKITTEAFTAIDSFYVTDENGAKVTDKDRIEAIQAALENSLRLES